MTKLLIGIYLLVFSLHAVQLYADVPLDTIKSRIHQVLVVLRDPALQRESAREAKKQKLRAIFNTTFDYMELSKSTLSRNWEKLKPDQREEFKDLYKALLEKVYMDTILAYKDQEVVFGRERALGQNRVEVESKLISGPNEIPIHYRMISKDGGWWVYDVVIENISLVTNYRSQFNRLLAKESPESMLEALRKKVS
ncbi:MAG: ABC transporter substrate-binding protein [Deltaproteobacteria bacterium]|nr:ABC transporter substrate-binding protein [Deltaproteobacteria bacterium]